MKLLLAIALTTLACLAACGSGETNPGTGGAAGNGTGGSNTGGTGNSGGCPGECFASSECVHNCGETPVNYGCCGCPPGTIDAHQCATGDAGCHPTVPDAGAVTCGDSTCNANQVCVYHCCGGVPDDSGTACKPAPPSCLDVTEVTCTPCDGTSNCSAPTEGCNGTLVDQTLNCQCA